MMIYWLVGVGGGYDILHTGQYVVLWIAVVRRVQHMVVLYVERRRATYDTVLTGLQEQDTGKK